MPYDLPIAELISVIGVIAGQAYGLWRLIDARFRRMEDSMQQQAKDLRDEMSTYTAGEAERHAAVSAEVNRVDRELIAVKGRVDALPTREQMSDMLDKKVDKLEVKFDRLAAMLARPQPGARFYEDNGA